MKLCHVTRRSGLLSLAPVSYSSDTCHMTQLGSFICLPQPPFWGIVFSSTARPIAAIDVGSASAVSLAFCVSCLESSRSFLKHYLNIITNPQKNQGWKKIDAIIMFYRRNWDVSEENNICIFKHWSSVLNLFVWLRGQWNPSTLLREVPATIPTQAHQENQSQTESVVVNYLPRSFPDPILLWNLTWYLITATWTTTTS